MPLISFAWTTPPLIAGRKTMTWRNWDDRYARQFKPGQLVDAYNRSPRQHGEKVATVRILSVEKISPSTLTDDDWEAEGLAYLYEHPEQCPKTLFGEKYRPDMVTLEGFRKRCQESEDGWCVRFELVEVLG
jgi:uncharacterized protein YqfB (UPF0267 family)